MSIPLDQLGSNAGGDDLRRDQWGRLLVVPPGGGDPVGYTRVTTVAKTLDDGGGLAPWKAAMTACGLMMRPGLRAQWEALISAHNGRPWYAGEQAKAACKRLVEESAEAGGASDRRDQGLSVHAILAMLDRDASMPPFLTPDTERDIEAYVNALAAHGVIVMPEFVEITGVLDHFQVGGTFDRIVRVEGFPLPMIADLKTGEDLTYSGGSFSVQLGGYSRFDSIYEQGRTPADDVRKPMPKVDQERGLIIHLPAGSGRCELHVVDLEAGWAGFQLSMQVRGWRKRKNLLTPITMPVVSQNTPFADTFVRDWRLWLQGRIDVCGRHSADCRADLIRTWPAELPSLGASAGHTLEMLAAIERILDGVEARHSVPFGTSRPGTQMGDDERIVGRLLDLFPGSTLTDNGASS